MIAGFHKGTCKEVPPNVPPLAPCWLKTRPTAVAAAAFIPEAAPSESPLGGRPANSSLISSVAQGWGICNANDDEDSTRRIQTT
jgi:hypothetical protein